MKKTAIAIFVLVAIIDIILIPMGNQNFAWIMIIITVLGITVGGWFWDKGNLPRRIR